MNTPLSPADDGRPIRPETGEKLVPGAQPGYYPGYDVLRQKAFWDEATRRLVLDRIEKIPPIRFFTAEEARLMTAVCDRIVPQDDRDESHRIPIVNFIDERLLENRLDGYRFESMPSDQEAYRLGLRAIEEIAQHMYSTRFVELAAIDQELVLKTVHDGDPPAAHDIWCRMSVCRFWLLLVGDVTGVYYAHPYAWNEIGFGGPAYPRGYMRLENGEPEPWEAGECRYDWAAQPGSPSAEFTQVGGLSEHHASPGQGGTH
jgi:Gluconate 2-dehydrogenase subunit 3